VASEHGKALLRNLASMDSRWRRRAPAIFAALYFLHWQIVRHGRAFAARKHAGDVRPDAGEWLAALDVADEPVLRARLLDYMGRYQFRGVSANVAAALCRWLRGDWPLELRADIPAPRAVLSAQARGKRPVTAITAYPRMLSPVLDKSDAFEFFLHDLEHAYKFFHSPALYAGQRAFFRALDAALTRGAFLPYLDEAVFAGKFRYLMSDMNTHPEHSRQYLRAILIEFHLRRAGKPLSAALPPAAQPSIDSVMRAVGVR